MFMLRWLLGCALLGLAAPAYADETATLLRVFLRDGSTLVSYGEPARVGDRIVFTMPTGALPNPPLHLVTLSLDKVDWDKTERYANSARAEQYLSGQAEVDYATLSVQLGQALNAVASTTDSNQRLAIVEKARRDLAEWPANHYNYRQGDVKQMVGMLDEAIADLRAASGASRFDLTFEAHTDAAPPAERLLPPPTLQESIEQVLRAANAVDNSIERKSLLTTALATIDSASDTLPAEWSVAARADAEARLRTELRVDQSYRVLSRSILALADQRARTADVRGVERLLARVAQRDELLGGKRPETVATIVGAVEEKLDAARRLRLARDRWALREPVLSEYREAIRLPMALFAQLKPSLEAIKALSGSSPLSLASIQSVTARIATLIAAIVPPEELAAAHALLASAAQMAANAASVRREAALAGDMELAWNASSAAAGALMLGGRARTDIQQLLRPPQLPR